MTHPVVNDVKIELWERLGVTCWPTLVIISPNCQLLYYIIGEGHGAELQLFMDAAVQYYKNKGQLNLDPITFDLSWRASTGGRDLWYPGKVCLDDRGERLFIADSSNHRILTVDRRSGIHLQQLVIVYLFNISKSLLIIGTSKNYKWYEYCTS